MNFDEAKDNEHTCDVRLKECIIIDHRQDHLKNHLTKAKLRKDNKAANEIISIMRRESEKKKYDKMRAAFGKPWGLPATQIAILCGFGPEQVFSTKDSVESVVNDHLVDRYLRLAMDNYSRTSTTWSALRLLRRYSKGRMHYQQTFLYD